MAANSRAKKLPPKSPVPNAFTREMGERVRRARLESGMRQVELAERVRARQATISAIENGKKEVSSSELVYLCAALQKHITYFFPEGMLQVVSADQLGTEESELLALFGKLSHTDQHKLIAQIRGLVAFIENQ